MKVKKVVLNSLLIAIGTIMHQIVPPLFLGLKPDFSLIMLFIIIIFDNDYKDCICAGIAVGIFSALTTGFPGGQLPNFMEKIITCNVIFAFLKFTRNRFNDKVNIILINLIGTIISGIIFLSFVNCMVGLPTKFSTLFISVIIPTCIINSLVGKFLFSIINSALRRGNINYSK